MFMEDKNFNPNRIIFSPPSGYVPQHDGVDNAPVFTLQKPITSGPVGIFVPYRNITSPMFQPNDAKPKGIKNITFGMFARKATR